MNDSSFSCGLVSTGVVSYLLRCTSSKRTYIGFTTDLRRRLRQHNSGRNRTKSTRGRQWTLVVHVAGFTSKRAGLQFEYAWKRMRRRDELRGVEQLLARGYSTKRAEPLATMPLMVHRATHTRIGDVPMRPITIAD
jgi:predicted GIY-YIG superfamily endonuclease